MIQMSKRPSKNYAMVCALRQKERTQQRGRGHQRRAGARTGSYAETSGLFPGGIGEAFWNRQSDHQSARTGRECTL
jgi:hypothetical protein